MDSSHVALVSLNLGQDGFEHFRADTNMVLGGSIGNLSKDMKLALMHILKGQALQELVSILRFLLICHILVRL